VLLVAIICLLNWFDLTFTLLANEVGNFRELNPIAGLLVNHSTGLVAFKFASLGVASIIFIVFRRHWFTEAACWCFFIVYTMLSLVWMSYYSYLSRCGPLAGP
jgi:hypothetical protein